MVKTAGNARKSTRGEMPRQSLAKKSARQTMLSTGGCANKLLRQKASVASNIDIPHAQDSAPGPSERGMKRPAPSSTEPRALQKDDTRRKHSSLIRDLLGRYADRQENVLRVETGLQDVLLSPQQMENIRMFSLGYCTLMKNRCAYYALNGNFGKLLEILGWSTSKLEETEQDMSKKEEKHIVSSIAELLGRRDNEHEDVKEAAKFLRLTRVQRHTVSTLNSPEFSSAKRMCVGLIRDEKYDFVLSILDMSDDQIKDICI